MAKQVNDLVDYLFKKTTEGIESIGKSPKKVKERISDSTGEIGSIDYPIDTVGKDKLFIQAQVKGLTEFLRNCDTPMTIAIQGSWGAGKSSYAELIKEQLHIIYGKEFDDYVQNNKEKIEAQIKKNEKPEKKLDLDVLRGKYIDDSCPFICFNSWKFTQFNLSNQLLTNMVTSLTIQLENGIEKKEGEKKSDDILRLMNNLARVGGVLMNSAIKEKFGVDISETAEDADWKGASGKETDYITLINKLQSNFQQLIYERLGITAENQNLPEYKNKRVIFFVDDLDRLSPDKAIDVLEVLKLFLDCKHCVFLLAIDYDVVVNGVKIKYKNSLGEEKGKEFFEKMIQVVYTLPSFLSRTDEYVKEILKQSKLSPLLAAEFSGLMKNGRKNNPRSIKRLINSFVLLDKMKMSYDKKPLSTETSIMLFAALCLQNICPEVFAFWNERFNNTVYNYIEGTEWFNEFIDFCYGVMKDEKNAGDWRKPYELTQMGLYENASENRLDRTKIQFLVAFFKKMHDTNNRKECYSDPFTSGSRYEIEDVLNLRNALQFAIVKSSYAQSKLGSTIPLIRIGTDMKYMELAEGTSKEAYLVTVQKLLENVDKDNFWIESNQEFGWREQARSVETIVKELEWMLSLEERTDGTWEKISYGESNLYVLLNPQSGQQWDELELAIWRANNARALAKKVNISFEWLACVNGEMHTIYEYHEVDAFICIPPFEICFITCDDNWIDEVKSRTIAEAYHKTVSACMQDLLDTEGWDRVEEVMKEMDFLFDYDELSNSGWMAERTDIVNEWSPEESLVHFKDGYPVYAQQSGDFKDKEDFLMDSDWDGDEEVLWENSDRDEDEEVVLEEEVNCEQTSSWYEEDEKIQGAVWSAMADKNAQRDYYIYTDISAFQMLENLEKLTNITKTRYVWYKDPYMIDEVVHGYWQNRGE